MRTTTKIESGIFKLYVDELLYLSFPLKEYLGLQSHINSNFVVYTQQSVGGLLMDIQKIITTRYFIEINLKEEKPILCEWEEEKKWKQILKALDTIEAKVALQESKESFEEELENNPQIKKDYEILSISCGSELALSTYEIPHNKEAYATRDGWAKSVLNLGCKIHSIKRLTDGEIFTIGDETNYGKIISVHQEVSSIAIRTKYGDEDSKHYDCHLNVIQHLIKKSGGTVTEVEGFNLGNQYLDYAFNESMKKLTATTHNTERVPLLKTEDGINIFAGDVCFYITSDWIVCRIELTEKIDDDRYFSTEQSAEQYISEHQPIYSVNELKNKIKEYADKAADDELRWEKAKNLIFYILYHNEYPTEIIIAQLTKADIPYHEYKGYLVQQEHLKK